ncbi:hypothetical protein T07_1123 [Trichinella nelsoni]|uniref:Uncharacterized protein n=1 Tax=Trichinella nelsoni TaxID=6336 RepID=A0A0V0RCL2_9BILA|nr:hypothetical protein T07_1123 [Trichinella nelsoni]
MGAFLSYFLFSWGWALTYFFICKHFGVIGWLFDLPFICKDIGVMVDF